MKKNVRLLLTALALVLTLSVCIFAAAADEEPEETYKGSDLPVSESYVIRALTALEERINQKIDTLAEVLMGDKDTSDDTVDTDSADTDASEIPPVTTEPEEETKEPAAVSMDYEVIYVNAGQAIIGNCEMILRSGTAIAFCPGINGISDLTAGADLADETDIPLNHLLLVPRDDGRGIFITSEEAYVMVRGTYTVLGTK